MISLCCGKSVIHSFDSYSKTKLQTISYFVFGFAPQHFYILLCKLVMHFHHCLSYFLLCFTLFLIVILLNYYVYWKENSDSLKIMEKVSLFLSCTLLESCIWYHIIPINTKQWCACQILGFVMVETVINNNHWFKRHLAFFCNLFLLQPIFITTYKRSHLNFSCCHWNVNSLTTDNYCIHKYNFIYYVIYVIYVMTFLDSSIKSDDTDRLIGIT